MHNTGSIDSAATVIFLAASERYAAKHSTFFVSWTHVEFCSGSAIDVFSIARELKPIQAR
jgi:ATP-dependent protease ClpP protease subunit